MALLFEKSLADVRTVDSNREYWFIRTYSGQTYTEFHERNYVGVGFNNVPYNLIKNSRSEKGIYKDDLRTYLINNYSLNKGEATKWANQLIAFEHKMSIGDYVLIPNENSNKIWIGEIVSNTKIVRDSRTFKFGDNYEPYPEKRKDIRWIKELNKADFQGDLSGVFFSRQAVTNINDYQNAIESRISSFFIVNNTGHLLIQIRKDEDINAFHFRDFLDCLTYFYEEICKETGEQVNDDLFIKIKVQSKGNMMLAGVAISGLLGVATLFTLADNPQVKLELGEYGSIEASGDGFLQSWSDFLDANDERQQKMILFQDSIEQIKARRNLEVDPLSNQPSEDESE